MTILYFAEKQPRLLPSIAIAFLLLLVVWPAGAADWVYSMRPGDNLWNVAERYLKGVGYVESLARYNQVADPYHIPPGTRIRIPVKWSILNPAPVTADEVTGDVRYRNSASEPLQLLDRGVTLSLDNQIVTGEDGNAVLRFADGSVLNLRANSILTLDTLSAFGNSGMVDSRVRLLQGRLEFKVKRKPEGESNFEVNTPAAANLVRGTEFRVHIDEEDPATRTEVTEGKVKVAAEGRSRLVPKNYGIVVQQGKPPAPPRPLLGAPNLESIPTRIEQVSFRIEWPAIEGAASYRTQVSATEDFRTVVFDRVTDKPHVTISDLPDGDYYLSVRATDTVGLEGLDGTAGFTLDARPEPPVTLKPQPDEIVRANPPNFTWAVTEGTKAYHLQVASDAEFADLIADMSDLRTTEIETENLANGDYYWRVALTDATGDRGPYCPPIPFEMREPPASLPVAPPEVTEDQVKLTWARFEGARYLFQLARDPGFENILVDEVLDEPTISMPKLLGGRYFLRIATIDDTGYQSRFGPTAHVDLPFN